MHFPRRAGLLLHITSLPSDDGIGDLGATAERFVDFLQRSGIGLWQMLPLGPTAKGNSPYSSFSAFAGNPLLISLERLIEKGWLLAGDVAHKPLFPSQWVDYESVGPWKLKVLNAAYERFEAVASAKDLVAFQGFCESERGWLHDFSLFMALSEAYGTADWKLWDKSLVQRNPEALEEWSAKLEQTIRREKFIQFVFFTQWRGLKAYANARGVEMFGDLPIFVAYESADVWASQASFMLDESGGRVVVAGVPPDYFSATGQLWGNPLYRWDQLAATGHAWWVERLRQSLVMYDLVRIDHFRGFEAYWEIPGSAETAIDGRWVKGPEAAPFRAAEAAGVQLRIVAEDLGMISEEVHALRNELDFPGMRVLQFGYDDDLGVYHRPESYPSNSVAYTGTHDNDTIVGWYDGRLERLRVSGESPEYDRLLSWLGTDRTEAHWTLIRRVFESAADTAIVPVQDVLGLGGEARMNIPGQPEGNWRWRCGAEAMAPAVEKRLLELTRSTQRA